MSSSSSTSKATRTSFCAKRSAASKADSAKVFASHAPKVGANNLKKPKIAKSTASQRDRALVIWGDYMCDDHPGVDADQVWVDLCRGDATAMQYCMSFLQVYVLTSVRQRIVLDDREEFEERTIKSSRSLNTFWKSLIAAADAEVLLPMREDPKNHWMTLKRPTNMPGSLDEGPVSQISQWIYKEGAEIMSLSTVSDYTKVEFTVTDIGLILKTLWLCADLVGFRSPIQRIIFHALVLLFSFGYRQGMIIGMKYREVVVALIRDDNGRPRLATTFTINRNKLRTNALEHSKGKKFQFTTTLLPYPLLCLTHLVCVVGIHFNIFKAGYTSVDDIFQRPNLEHVNYVHLEWHDDILDQKIFPMSYSSFTRTLHHVLLVAGFSTVARVYAFRLGALIEYDGSLTQAVRNFVASVTGQLTNKGSCRRRVTMLGLSVLR